MFKLRIMISIPLFICFLGCSDKNESTKIPANRHESDSVSVSDDQDEMKISDLDYSQYYGSWYEKTFLQSAFKSRSIKKAYSYTSNLRLHIFKQSDGKQVINYGSFHDSGVAQVFPISGTEFSLYEFNSSEQTNDKFNMPMDDGGPILWNSNEFISTLSLDALLNFAILDGVYLDEEGQEYSFDQGSAEWPNKKFEYYLRLDLYGVDTDVIFEEDKSQRDFPDLATGFLWEGETIKLFKYKWLGEGDLLERIHTPIAILTPIVPERYFDAQRFMNLPERTVAELRLLRNEILARHGHDFYSFDLKIFFSAMKWYERVKGKKVADSELYEGEAILFSRIKEFEKMAL